jgi:hypothetical protein
MSQASEMCCFCGEEIIFRVIQGVTTPFHTDSNDCIFRRLYRRDQEGIAHPTKCPRCEANVFFLRHNGGSVWLESLGWPWPKHPCFEEDSQTRNGANVIPLAAASLKGGHFVLAGFIGQLASHEGVVVRLLCQKRDSHRESKYQSNYQWVVECSPDEAVVLKERFQGLTVIVSFEELRLITLDGLEFRIRKHEPKYYH